MPDEVKSALCEDMIALNVAPKDKQQAIEAVGRLLVKGGVVDAAYIESMLKREGVANTWLGEGVAIPHGMVEDRGLVHHDGVAVLQVPQGVVWQDGNKAKLIFAIAANSDGHIEILKRLTRLLSDKEKLERLSQTKNKADILAALSDNAPPSPQERGRKAKAAEDLPITLEWVLDYPSGLHARPASSWVDAAKAIGRPIRVRKGEDVADMKNMASLLQLGAKEGDTLIFSTDGADGRDVLQTIVRTVKKLSAKEKESAAKAKAAMPTGKGFMPPSGVQPLKGVAASPGLVIGVLYPMSQQVHDVIDEPVALREGAVELQQALSRTRLKMKALVDDITRRIGAQDAAIFKAQATLLDDENLVALACRFIVEGHGVAWSWQNAVDETAGKLASLDNAVLAARAGDLRDVGQRVLSEIDARYAKRTFEDLPKNAIIAASDLSPSDTANLDPAKVKGLVTALGGPSSHTAILARTLGIPSVVALGAPLLDVKEGVKAIVDGNGGALFLNPDEGDVIAAEKEIKRLKKLSDDEAKERKLLATTKDGTKIAVAANINSADQVPFALDAGAEGVGLMRTEFIFLERGDTPDEDEQYHIYRAMIEALGPRPLIIRALDIGGDKQVAHLNLPKEENPFLGVRGARLLLRRPDLLVPQLRAIYRAAKDQAAQKNAPLPWVMFPMIMSVKEVEDLKEIAKTIRRDLDAPKLKLGIMIEVPAAAIMADVLAEHVDFFSIGTNDLTQYTLAVDRQNPELAAEADSLNPAVLRMIHETVRGAKKHKRWVGVCGGAAGDPLGAMLLVGLGVHELSMTPRDIAPVKARLRSMNLKALQALAQKALRCETALEVRALEGKAK